MLDLTPYSVQPTSAWHRMRTETHTRKSWAVYRMGRRVGTIVGYKPRRKSKNLAPAHFVASTEVSTGTFRNLDDAFSDIVKYCR